jgi:hypothetical protein
VTAPPGRGSGEGPARRARRPHLAALARRAAELEQEAAALEERLLDALAELDAAGGAGGAGGAGLPVEERECAGLADAPWRALADRVLPLSLKDPGAPPEVRRLAGLQRQQARLHREGDALAADARALCAQGHDLNHSARAGDAPVQAWRADVLAWAAEVLQHQRRTARWGDALATHQRRRRQHREGI